MPDPSSPLGALAPLGGVRFARLANVVLLEEAGSTNDVARRIVERALAESEEILPTVVVTRRQPRGRGRAGRSWLLPEGRGLALSLIVPWPEGPERVRVPIAWGIALAEGLSRAFLLDVRLKWPNDLLAGGKKLGGLLVEARAADGEGYAVVGLGLNVTATYEDLADLPAATSLLLEGASRDRLAGDVPLISLLRILDAGLEDLPSDLPGAFARFSAHAPGDRLRVADGARTVEGRYTGVTGDGFLKLETESGERILVSGDVTRF